MIHFDSVTHNILSTEIKHKKATHFLKKAFRINENITSFQSIMLKDSLFQMIMFLFRVLSPNTIILKLLQL